MRRLKKVLALSSYTNSPIRVFKDGSPPFSLWLTKSSGPFRLIDAMGSVVSETHDIRLLFNLLAVHWPTKWACM